MADEDIGALIVRIEADISDLTNNFNKVSGKIETAGKSAISFGDVLKANVLSGAILGGLKIMGNLIGSAADKLIGFAKSGIEVASNLQEVQNVVDTTFGESASAIDKFAKSAATNFGLSELSAKQFSGTMGAMLKSTGLAGDAVTEMSTNLSGLAGDMASFYNLDAEDAFNKLRSGISGETEPLKQLGINMSVVNLETYAMSQGIKKSYKDMTQAEQTTLRYNYIMQATADAQGDFAKTSDSYANQQRIMQLNMENLSATIGGKLLPVANALTGAFSGLISGELNIDDFVSRLQEAMEQLFETGQKYIPDIVKMGGTLLSSLLDGIIGFLPTLLESGVPIVTSLITGIVNALPKLAQVAITVISELVKSLLLMLPDMLRAGMEILTAIINGIAQSLPELIPIAIQSILTMIKTLYENMPMLIDAGIQLLQGLATGIMDALPLLIGMLPGIIQAWSDFMNESLPQIAETGVSVLISLINGLIEALPQLIAMLPTIISTILSVLTKNLPQIINAGITILIALINGLIGAIPQLVDAAIQIIFAIVDFLLDPSNISTLISAAIQIVIALASGIVQAIPQLMASVIKLITSIGEKFRSINWGDIGLGIIKGIANGILNGAATIATAAKNAAQSALTAAKNLLGIHSPSSVAEDEVGDQFGLGIVRGIEKSKKLITSAVEGLNNSFSLNPVISPQTTYSDIVKTTPLSNNTTVGEKTTTENNKTINFERMFEGAIFNVRSDNDIKLIARELYNLQTSRARAMGVT